MTVPSPDPATLTFAEARALADRLSADVRTYGHFIGGAWVEGNSGETIALSNPATRKVLAHIQSGDAVDADRAVKAAQTAQPGWGRSPAADRQALLLGLAARLRARMADYAMMETLNNGKTIREAFGDIAAAANLFDYYAGAAHQLNGEVADFADATMLIHREPIGVVAQVIPWNAALLMAATKIAPALAAGCAIVLKPAETVCLAVLAFAQDAADLIPPGVLNIVTGYGERVGEPLVAHPGVRKVTFTGSRETARRIIGYASRNIIPQTMELGGKSANIVCADADLDAAALSVVETTIRNKGEVCLAGSRLFVHQAVRAPLLERVVRLFGAVRQGDPVDPATQIGAQSSERQFQRVLDYIGIGKAEGAVAACGGERASVAGLSGGLFIQPTLFTGVHNAMRIAQEEIFGPVTCMIEWEDEAELIRAVNDSAYGLGGGLWTRDLARAHRLSRAMETGTVWVNRYYDFKPGLPIGGYKQSGFGREGTLDTVRDYLVTKSVVIHLPPEPRRANPALPSAPEAP